ncbi:MAG TPA: CYTH domain-containing protein [Verrucomicrobiae bacterium]|nr:CYTH domain-containing protein [Verrucomicrobiae bacterium]
MNSYEIEIKTLLGNKDQADALVERMKAKDPNLVSVGSHKQLNHYFEGGDINKLKENLKPHLPEEKQEIFESIIQKVKDYSIRSRWADGKVIFVMKASVDDTTASNGTARMEFESAVNLTLEQLDQVLLDSGFKYQAKWSRERTDYKFKDMNVSVDKNAGYGYLAEFEIVETDPSKADETKSRLRQTMSELGVEELNQDRLARMFDFYNNNWQDYYGTEKVFVIQ